MSTGGQRGNGVFEEIASAVKIYPLREGGWEEEKIKNGVEDTFF